MKTGVEHQDHSHSEKVLSWRKANRPGSYVVENTTTWSARIVDSVLQSQNGGGLAIGNSVLQRGSVGSYSLPKSCGTAVAVPINLGTYSNAEARSQRPMHG